MLKRKKKGVPLMLVATITLKIAPFSVLATFPVVLPLLEAFLEVIFSHHVENSLIFFHCLKSSLFSVVAIDPGFVTHNDI